MRLAEALINAGTLNSGLSLTNETGATLINTGTVALTPTFNGPVTITNSGTVINLGSIVGTGTYTQTAGQTINNGSLTVTSVIINGGALNGTGTITANVHLLEVGPSFCQAIRLGRSPSTERFKAAGTCFSRSAGTQPGQFDVLAIHGMAFLNGGNITFDFINGFVALARDSWDFLYALAITGWDTLTFTVNGLRSNQTYAFSYANGSKR